MSFTIEQLKNNKNIKADRFGMAAISYIFKAFGDNVRSKEYWPWGDKVNMPWAESLGFKNDITNAMILLTAARERYDEDLEKVEIKENNLKSIKDLLKRLRNINMRNKAIHDITSSINETSSKTQSDINNI